MQDSSSEDEDEEISVDAADTAIPDVDSKYPSFGTLNPAIVEEAVSFPGFPPSHPEGYATVIDLAICGALSEEAVLKLRDGL